MLESSYGYSWVHPHTHNAHTHIQYLLDPHEGVVEFRVDTLQVLNSQFLTQHLLVEWHAETVVYKFSVIQGLPRERGREGRRGGRESGMREGGREGRRGGRERGMREGGRDE